MPTIYPVISLTPHTRGVRVMRTLLLLALLLGLGLILTAPATNGQPPSAPASVTLLSAPPPPPVAGISASNLGNSGNNSYCWWVVPTYPIGDGPINTSPACLNQINGPSAANTVRITWPATPSATGYRVLRSTSPTLPITGGVCVGCSVTTTALTTFTDTGAAGTNYTPGATAGADFILSLDNLTTAAAIVRTRLAGVNYTLPQAVGTPTAGNCAQWAAGGNLTDSGAVCGGGGGGGDVVGPAGATANSVALFDGVTGKLLKSPSGFSLSSGNQLLQNVSGVATTLIEASIAPTDTAVLRQINGSVYGDTQAIVGNNSSGVYNYLYKSRTADGVTRATVNNGDYIFGRYAYADNGAAWRYAGGSYEIIVDGVFGATIPTKQVWGSSTVNGALTLFDNGNYVVGLGSVGDGGYRVDINRSGTNGTFRVYDQTAATGVTKSVVRAGAGQSTTNLQEWQNNGGGVVAAITPAGVLTGVVRSFGGTFASSDGVTPLTAGATSYFVVPYACTITAWNVVANAGTATVDIWKVATGTAIPTAANTITAAATPALSVGTAVRSTTLTGWTTAVAANDIIGVNLEVVATATYVNLTVECVQ